MTTGVDVSSRMLEIAEAKLHDRQVRLVQDDALNYVTENDLSRFNVIVSTTHKRLIVRTNIVIDDTPMEQALAVSGSRTKKRGG